MKKHIFFLALAGFAFAFSSCGENEVKVPATDTVVANKTNDAAPSGDVVYESKCKVCHGADGKAGIMGAADLSTSTLSHEGAFAIVKNGKNTMKAFAGELTAEEMDAVVKYAESLRK